MTAVEALPEAERARRARLRRVLGQFATGVAVMTARSRSGRCLGITVNSFASVSLTPPMALWCIAKDAPSHPELVAATHATVHILAADQDRLARRFATGAADKFAELSTTDGPRGVPLLGGVIARMHCATLEHLDGGDHTIVLARIDSYEMFDGEPLVFHAGDYRVAIDHPAYGR